ncbi:MFS transporter, partial [Saccharopolyspora kobensis]
AAAIGVAALLPTIAAPPAAGLRERLAPLRDGKITVVLLTTVAFFIGIFTVNTYISVIVEPATGNNSALLAMLLFLSGAAGTAGNLISGGWTDRFGARRVIAVAMVIALINCLLLPITAETLVSAVPAVLVFGLTAWSVTVPQQHRLIEAAPSATSLVISLNASGGYLGSSLAGLIGAAALELSPTSLPLVAAVFIVIGLAASELAQRIGARS